MEISTPVYVNPLSDSGFKAIFCDPANKSDLIALLNVFLRPAGRQVEDLEYATTELPGVSLSNKASRVDLRCTDASGRRFIVEVQRGAQPRFFAVGSSWRCSAARSRASSGGACTTPRGSTLWVRSGATERGTRSCRCTSWR